MPLWIKAKTTWILIALAICAGYTLYVYHAGSKGAAGVQAVAQIKHDHKIRRAYAKIDHQVPSPDNRAAERHWVSKFTAADR